MVALREPFRVAVAVVRAVVYAAANHVALWMTFAVVVFIMLIPCSSRCPVAMLDLAASLPSPGCFRQSMFALFRSVAAVPCLSLT